MNYVQRRRFLWILFLAGLALLAAVAQATTFARLRLEELAQKAAAVARLRCVSSESRWSQGEIWTDTRFEVLAAEKGALPRVVTVRTPGGRVREVESHVDGTPRFQPGEEVYLFLWGQPGEPYRVLGWTQGTFRIGKDGATKRETVTQDSATTAIFDPLRREFRAEGVRKLPVAEFLERLRRAVAEAR
jgi:hypothetical protein